VRLLVTGASGMLGHDVCRAAAEHDVMALSHGQLDVTDREGVERAIARAGPKLDAVINCAAWTDVDLAEREVDSAFAANAVGAGNVARAAGAAGAWTIHLSTDYVFDGERAEPYLESDPPAPLSAYGRSKLAGERAVAEGAPDAHTIVRASWLFGAGGRCFPATILQLAAEREQISVVDDQVGCPTFSAHLAQALIELAQRAVSGIVHVAASAPCSWFEFAQAIVAESNLKCEVLPIATSEMPRPARRPAYSVLGSERPSEAPRLPPWREGLTEFLAAAVGTR
jgi:dTDP-4-dehydrorhamnose reductase